MGNLGLSSWTTLYANVNVLKPKEYSDYENYTVPWEQQNNYQLVKKIGNGRYGEVFEGVNISSNQKCAVKVLKPVTHNKILKEIKILKNLSGGTNIIALQAVVRDQITMTPSLVFEYVNNVDYNEFYDILTDVDIRYYIHELLKALDYCHSMGIMHRDVKPQNILIDHENRKLRLIDFGLSEFYFPGKEYKTGVGTRLFKAPELLMDYKLYNYSSDIWSLGCILALMIFKKGYFFNGRSDYHQLAEIFNVLGTYDLVAYLNKYDILLNPHLHNILIVYSPRQHWETFACPENEHLLSLEAFDFLDKVLCYDHLKRITTRDALRHPYFYPSSETSEANSSSLPTTSTSTSG